MFKKLAVKVLKSKLGKGHLTWGSVVVMLIPVLSQALGYDAGADVNAVIAGVGAFGTLVGKARAVYQAAQKD